MIVKMICTSKQSLSAFFGVLMFVILPTEAFEEQIVANISGQVVLQCYLDDGDETVKWYKTNKTNEEEIIHDGTKYDINANNTLTVKKIGDSDVGIFVCKTASKNKTFVVSAGSYVKPLSRSVNLSVGDKLVLDCIAWGYPIPNVTWHKNSEKGNEQLHADERIKMMTYGKVENATLIISSVTIDDYGIYMCNASNDYGSAQSSTKVRVKGKLAPLWPFIGICVEVIILVVIIIIYEKRKSKQNYDEDAKDSNLTNSNDHQEKEKVRLRK